MPKGDRCSAFLDCEVIIKFMATILITGIQGVSLLTFKAKNAATSIYVPELGVPGRANGAVEHPLDQLAL